MSQPNAIPPPRQTSPHLLTPTNTPPTHQHSHSPHPMLENFPDHRQHLLAIFSQGTHSFCQEDREEKVVSGSERRKSFVEQSYPTPPGSRRPSFLSGLTLSRPFVFTTPSQPSSGTSTPIHSSSPQSTTFKDNHFQHHTHDQQHHPTNPKSTAMTPTSADNAHLPALGAVVGNDGVAKKKINGFEGGKKAVVEDRRHFDPSREPRLLHLI